MTITPLRRFCWIVFAFLCTLGLPAILPVHAMTVSPVRLELNGNPGSVVQSTFKVFNDEATSQTLYTAFENFEASGETGTPSFKPGEEGLAAWISAPANFTVPAGESQDVNFTITIPETAEPGGYFAAIFVGNTPTTSNPSEVVIGSRLGSLVLFRVNGPIEEGGSLLEFTTKNSQKWFTALPINFYYRFQNSGADRIFPQSSLTIKNMLGRTTTILDANPTEGNVLPGSTRRFEVWWKARGDDTSGLSSSTSQLSFFETVEYQWHNFAFGKYNAHLDITYGSTGEKTQKSFALFVVPWQLLVIELVGVLVVLFLGRFIIKRYNRYIIKRARS